MSDQHDASARPRRAVDAVGVDGLGSVPSGGPGASTPPAAPPTEPPIGAAPAPERDADGPPVAADPDGGLASAAGLGLLALVSLTLTGISAAAVWRMQHAWRSADATRRRGPTDAAAIRAGAPDR